MSEVTTELLTTILLKLEKLDNKIEELGKKMERMPDKASLIGTNSDIKEQIESMRKKALQEASSKINQHGSSGVSVAGDMLRPKTKLKD